MPRTLVQLLDFHPRAQRSMEVFLVSLARELAGRDWRTVYVVAGEPGEFFASEMQQFGSPVIVTRFPLNAARTWQLRGALKPYHPTAIQATFVSKMDPLLWSLKWLVGARALVIADHSSGTVSQKRGVKKILNTVRSFAANRAIDRVITVSDFVRNRDIVELGLHEDKFHTIYNGVDLDRFSYEVHVDDGALMTLLFVGQLLPEKGIRTLLAAFVQLIDSRPSPCRLLIAGKGPLNDELQKWCREKNLHCVEFLGQVDEVEDLYRKADIVVVPSEWGEAFGFVGAEAMSCGACVLVSDAGGIPEVVGTDGHAGRIFKKGDVNDLRQKLGELMDAGDLRRQMRVAARARVEQLFSIKKMVEGYVRVLDEIK